MNTILLTGGTGFLGSRLLDQLLKEKYSVILLKRSSSDLKRIGNFIHRVKSYDNDISNLENIFSENNIQTVIHCATDYGKHDSTTEQVTQTNFDLPSQLLELSKKNNCRRFINTDTILPAENSNYAFSKNKFLQLFKSYEDFFSCINIKTEQFYGPGEDHSKFISFVILNFLNGEEKIKLTLGEQERGFLFIDDLINAFIKIIKASAEFKNGFYNYEIGVDEKINIRTIATLIKKMTANTKTQLEFGAIPYRENELMNYTLNTTEIKKLGWVPETTFEQGIKKTIEYLLI